MAGSVGRNKRLLVVPYLALAVGLAMSVVLLVSLGSRASGTPTPTTAVAYDMMIPETDRGRAEFGNIFIGTVLRESGTDEVPTSDPDDVIPILLYDVEIEETLRGNAQGVVRIWYEGFDDRSPDATESRKLREGERILFFAGYNPDKDWYPVNASIGVIPIGSDREGADLVATFTPLIREAEQAASSAGGGVVEDPCERQGEPAAITAEPRSGRQGDDVRLTGGSFARAEVVISWDDRDQPLGTAEVGKGCAIETTVSIPKAEVGEHRLLVRDAYGRTAETTIMVVE